MFPCSNDGKMQTSSSIKEPKKGLEVHLMVIAFAYQMGYPNFDLQPCHYDKATIV